MTIKRTVIAIANMCETYLDCVTKAIITLRHDSKYKVSQQNRMSCFCFVMINLQNNTSICLFCTSFRFGLLKGFRNKHFQTFPKRYCHYHTVKSTVRRMSTPVLISFSTWVNTIFFQYMDCTAIFDMTVHPFLTLHDAETSVLWETWCIVTNMANDSFVSKSSCKTRGFHPKGIRIMNLSLSRHFWG